MCETSKQVPMQLNLENQLHVDQGRLGAMDKLPALSPELALYSLPHSFIVSVYWPMPLSPPTRNQPTYCYHGATVVRVYPDLH